MVEMEGRVVGRAAVVEDSGGGMGAHGDRVVARGHGAEEQAEIRPHKISYAGPVEGLVVGGAVAPRASHLADRKDLEAGAVG